jgi:hypothetical protein
MVKVSFPAVLQSKFPAGTPNQKVTEKRGTGCDPRHTAGGRGVAVRTRGEIVAFPDQSVPKVIVTGRVVSVTVRSTTNGMGREVDVDLPESCAFRMRLIRASPISRVQLRSDARRADEIAEHDRERRRS